MEHESLEEHDKDWEVVAEFMNVSDEDISTFLSQEDLAKIEADEAEFTSRPGYRERINALRDRAIAKPHAESDVNRSPAPRQASD